MAVIYVDPLNGTDNTDSGRGETEGTGSVSGAGAYASISYALANYGSFSTTEGNTIKLADTAADVLTSSLDTDTSVASANAPLCIEGYHYDGSNGGTAGALTMTLPFGNSGVTCGEIDGNDAVSYLFDVNTTNTILKNLKLHSTTSYVIWFTAGSFVYDCEIYNGGSAGTAYLGSVEMAQGLYVHTDQSGGTAIFYPKLVDQCEVKGHATGCILNTGGPGGITNSLIHGFTTIGLSIANSHARIENNTIDGGSLTSNTEGIKWTNAAFDKAVVINNLITNCSATGCNAIEFPSGASLALLGNNAFYNNTTDESADTPALDFDNITETSDPYTDSANDDFSLVSGALSNDAAILTNHNRNVGAWQEKPTGGGGGGETTSVFMA